MERLVSAVARLASVKPAQTAQDALRSTVVLAGVGLLFVTCWFAWLAGATLLVARGIGLVPALFTIGGGALGLGLRLLLWLNSRITARRREHRARVQIWQATLAAILTTLPQKRTKQTILALAGIVGLMIVLGKSGNDADDAP